ncbi:hypothetical protein MKZ38_010010 [Zalerion maritima]|uniref:methylcrotonoyl-CoA carboxylase n=1 Tax=Zalerion maritima TaxID=339359 RepID=A0AAD5RGA7_9PEZI|nr:hypothetical protein MKZ38_010010 [Zalerion maritima]
MSGQSLSFAGATSRFPVIPTKIPSQAPTSEANLKAWAEVLDEYRDALEKACSQGSAESVEKHSQRGQLLGARMGGGGHARARARAVSLILDEQSPFLELGAFAGHDNPDSTPSASLVTGIGLVNRVPVMIIAHIPTINGGAWNELTVRKQNRATEIATENKLPIIALVQSQFRVFHIGGQIFRDLARRTQDGCPSCAIVFGSSTAGGAYHPALSDYTIFVEGQAQVFLGGPPLVKMATGEVAEAEALGGAEMHATVTGLADQLAVDEFDAIEKARDWVLVIARQAAGSLSGRPQQLAAPPAYDPEQLLQIVDPDIRKPMDMMEVILRIVDRSAVEVFKPNFGKGMITAWANIHGHLAGIIANQQPVINPDEADKSTHFIHLCNQSRIPIIFLHNVTGFMVGTRTERAGLIKKGARFVSAVSTSTVPHVGVICGASYGAGNYAMCGRSYRPRFLFTWPTGRCSVMGPAQLSGVMENITRASAARSGRRVDETGLAAEVGRFRDGVERDSRAYATSGNLLDDGIVDPRDTRDVLGMCLEVVKSGEPVKGSAGSSILARI